MPIMSSPPSLAREPASPPNQVFSKLSNGLQQQQQQQQQHRDDFPNNSNSLQKSTLNLFISRGSIFN